MRKDITGKAFGHLTALSPAYKYFHGTTQEWVWKVRCVCGKIVYKRIGQLSTGDSKSCGCMRSKMISKSKVGSKNPMWAANDVGYAALHQWVKRRFKKPKLCQRCKTEQPRDLANRGVYDRKLSNWEWLCRRCHMDGDGRLKALEKHQFKPRETNDGREPVQHQRV